MIHTDFRSLLRVWFWAFYVVAPLGTIWAQSTPKFSNEFLNIGVSARAMGMGNAQSAIADDATAGYWNPANLVRIQDQYSISLMHAEYFAGIAQYDYAGFATPIDENSALGISLIRFGVDDIPDTRFLYDANGQLNYNNIRFFSAADYAFLISYARKIPKVKGLSVGTNLKIVYRNVGDFANAWGFGLDAGAQYVRNGWRLGLMVRDITTTFNMWTHNTALLFDIFAQTGNIIPQNSIEITLPKAIIGIGHQFEIKEKFQLIAALDAVMTFDGQRNVAFGSRVVSLDPHLGIEMNYAQRVYLRGGVFNFQTIKDFDGSTYRTFQPNFGVGIRLGRFGIDYALTDVGNVSDALYSHVFSVKVGF
ncbi:PorV/PorQ family protein [Eisenibacter elegans]|jgi:hypothetical protein|uniref:putative type IX sorting system protein PorV2 n=1 Tax=Eisenibacter elegans TaxID=997 RepID=UPI0003F52500|nr:PorV/PorQ family protein [Eisenibacter elegans]